MTKREEGYVEVDGIRLHYHEWAGEEPVILVVHGLTSNGIQAADWIDSLKGRFRIIAPDLRGRGDSDRPEGPYGIQRHAQDLLGLVDALGIKQVVFIGLSLGAGVGVQFAANYPDRLARLILGDGGGVSQDPARFENLLNSLQASIARIRTVYPGKDQYLDFWRQNPYFGPRWNPSLENWVSSDMKVLSDGRVRSKASETAIEADIQDIRSFKFDECYQSIICPTLLVRATDGIFSEDDLVLPLDVTDRMMDQIQDCQLYNVNGSNHYSIFLEHQPGLDKAMVKFIEE